MSWITVNTKDCSGLTKLHHAAASGVMSAHGGVQYLLQEGADLNIGDSCGRTPLMYAACWGHADIVKYLHRAGADLNIRDNHGVTAVMWAASWGHGDVV